MSDTDPLTDLMTKEAFLHVLDDHCVKGGGFTLTLMDVDHFKRFNDAHGHAMGDAFLARTAGVIRKNLRATDIACRYGGEEFAILCPDTTPEVAFVMMEDIRRTCAEREFHLSVLESRQKVSVSISLSVGIAGFPRDGKEAIDLLRASDEALYRAKVGGRNRTVLAVSEKMKLKSSYFTTSQLERLSRLSGETEKSEAFLLREALDELLRKYGA